MEATQILEILGIEGAEDLEQFKTKFNSSFVNRKIAIDDEEIKSKIVGKFTGGINTLLKREFGFESTEIEGKKVEEIVSLGLTKLRGKISELETNAGKNKDEAVAELQGKLEKYKKDYTDFKSQNETLSKALEEKEVGFQNEKKSWIINQKFGEVQKKAHSLFSQDAISNALTMEGFNTIIAKKYKFDLDLETNELSVFGADGNRIVNPNKIGSFLSPEEVLLKEATENKLIKLNGGAGAPIVPKPTYKAPEGGAKDVKLHPNLSRFKTNV